MGSPRYAFCAVRFLQKYAYVLGIYVLKARFDKRGSTLYSQKYALNRTTLYFPYDLTLCLTRSTLTKYALKRSTLSCAVRLLQYAFSSAVRFNLSTFTTWFYMNWLL